jgi:pimeloyl-ACP methyl ester carboxylesterase
MLPSNYWINNGDNRKDHNNSSNRSFGHGSSSLRLSPPPPPPALCVTGAMSRVGHYVVKQYNMETKNDDNETSTSFSPSYHNNHNTIILSYVIFRPRQLHSMEKPPLICLHGGPSIPSNYLLSIVNGVTDRSVLFYDQYGCGKSSRPTNIITTTTNTTTTTTVVVDDNNNNNNNNKTINNKNCSLPSFSISEHVEHLHQLIQYEWKLSKFHLLGHSWGGILAFEYLKMKKKMTITTTMTTTNTTMEDHQQHQQQLRLRQVDDSGTDVATSTCTNCGGCSSLTLSSTPTSSKLIEEETKRLYQELMNQDGDTTPSTYPALSGSSSSVDPPKDHDTLILSSSSSSSSHPSLANASRSTQFQQTHECRLPQLPLALMDSLAQVGPVEWRGLPAIIDYQVQGNLTNNHNSSSSSSTISDCKIPTLIMRGEYDFCTAKCIEKWPEHLSSSSSDGNSSNIYYKTLDGCSHYAMLEDERQYGQVVTEFLQQHDP